MGGEEDKIAVIVGDSKYVRKAPQNYSLGSEACVVLGIISFTLVVHGHGKRQYSDPHLMKSHSGKHGSTERVQNSPYCPTCQQYSVVPYIRVLANFPYTGYGSSSLRQFS